MCDMSRPLTCSQMDIEPPEIKSHRAVTFWELGRHSLLHDHKGLTLAQHRKGGACFTFTLHRVPCCCVLACQHWQLFPDPAQAVFVWHHFQFQKYIALTRILASSSSSHSFGSFPSFSRVGCKEHGHFTLTTVFHRTLCCAALDQSRVNLLWEAALICRSCFLSRPCFYFCCFNMFFFVGMSYLSLILAWFSSTCQNSPIKFPVSQLCSVTPHPLYRRGFGT